MTITCSVMVQEFKVVGSRLVTGAASDECLESWKELKTFQWSIAPTSGDAVGLHMRLPVVLLVLGTAQKQPDFLEPVNERGAVQAGEPTGETGW